MITILQPGLFTTIQDLGRIGYQKQGVPTSGALDTDAHRIANLLVGNDESCASIEMTLQGAQLKFEEATIIAIYGKGPKLSLNHQLLPVGKPVFVEKGSIIRHVSSGKGARTYMAVAGGIDVPPIMESRSTYTRASVGGYKGRRLEKDDPLETGKRTAQQEKLLHVLREERPVNWFVPKEFLESTIPDTTIQLIKSEQFESFTEESQNALFNKPLTVSSQSDRMGYRLEGVELKQSNTQNEVSSAVPFGTVQVPPDGKPILLLADRQTTGGYPVIGYTASIDRHKLAQLMPGQEIRFEQVELDDAHQQFYIKEEAMKQLKTGIRLQLKGMIK